MPKKKRFDVDSGSQDQAGYLYHDRAASEPGRLEPALWQSNPGQTAVRFPENTSNTRRFDFGPWYDGRIDAITLGCQQVIEALLEERNVAPVTVLAYCRNGLTSFLGFCRSWSSALDRPMALADIDSALIERFVLDLKGQGIGYATQRSYDTYARSVLLALGCRGWIETDDLFPRNPFPHANSAYRGEKPLSAAERRRVVTRLKADLAEIQQGNEPLTSNELAVCVLGIAVRSGINPVPLTELPTDCIREHPIKHDRKLLVSYKRRGQATQVQALRRSEDIRLLKTVMMDVDAIVDLARRRNAEIRASSAQYADRLFVYLSRHQQNRGQVRAITLNVLQRKIPSWSARMHCANYVDHCRRLRSKAGKPLAPGGLMKRFAAVEKLHRLASGTADAFSKPWPDTSSKCLSGATVRGPWKSKTLIIPDGIWKGLVQAASARLEEADALLDIRVQLDGLRERCRRDGWSRRTEDNRAVSLVNQRGYRRLRDFESRYRELQSAAMVVILSLSGIRVHELCYLSNDAWHVTDNDGETTYWMRSRSDKTGEGDTEWMIPELVTKALDVAQCFAAPL
jgi:phosphoribosyl-AMP cyclohydrolase